MKDCLYSSYWATFQTVVCTELLSQSKWEHGTTWHFQLLRLQKICLPNAYKICAREVFECYIQCLSTMYNFSFQIRHCKGSPLFQRSSGIVKILLNSLYPVVSIISLKFRNVVFGQLDNCNISFLSFGFWLDPLCCFSPGLKLPSSE